MDHTNLGRTGLEVSVIGIGTEHMRGQPRESVVSTLRAAVERGVNYFDIIYAMPEYLQHMGEGFHGLRDRVLLTAHLGSTDKDGQYNKTRAVKRCESSFLDVLRGLGTDHVDVLFLHNFNALKDWDRSERGGYLDLAARLRDEGKARFVGISGHYHAIMETAIESGRVDLIMLPVNLFNHAMPGRGELLDLCLRSNIGVVAMKPLGGGKLLNQRGSLRVPKYQTSGEAFQVRIGREVTPAQCLSYVLAQRGVSLALAGLKNEDELAAALYMLEASEAERDFSGLLAEFGRYVDGECTYCNHCLPCPEAIDIGQVNRLLDLAGSGLTPGLQASYQALPARASACTECGACTKRCPFAVDVVSRMQQAKALFERAA
ncbi:MAG: aldo/keto reductase [Anaerolineae bacterium]|nr:aldo/keto reductase [Anaerolineae bacterium]